MADLRTAAQQALEALDGVLDSYGEPLDLLSISGGAYEALQCREAITTLRAALAQQAEPVQEPVATFDDPYRDHWAAIAEAAQRIAASKECGPAEAKALCAALDRLTEATLAEPVAFDPAEAGQHEYGSTDCATFAGLPMTDGDRRLAAMLTQAVGTNHPAINDLAALLFAARGKQQAEPVQEPVAWHYTNNAGASVWHRGPSTRLDADMQAARDYPRVHKVTPLYTASPQRKPLTDEEIEQAHGIKEAK